MQFDGIPTNVTKEGIYDQIENLCGSEYTAECENVSEMEFSESPRSSTSTEFAEFSIPPQSNDDSEDNDESSASEELVVNLPAGVCDKYFLLLFLAIEYE